MGDCNMGKNYCIALDQGTTSSRALLFDREGTVIAAAQYPFKQHYPQPGWVEHDPMDLLRTQFRALGDCVAKSGVLPRDIGGIGITNQRETALVWEKATGKPVCNAIVWQCRRTAALCDTLREQGWEEKIRDKTGLLLDAYFSGTKFHWILEHIPGAKEKAARGELLCGTVDSWLIWNLTGGGVHVSDYSNCARTMLFNIHTLAWDEGLCKLLGIPLEMLPQPVPNSMEYGRVASHLPGLENLAGLPICGAAGDQQAALFGQACFTPGQVKNTYGTGCFLLMNTGSVPVRSQNGLLTTVGWSLGGETTYVLEGSVFHGGSVIQWLRDELGIIQTAHESDLLAESIPDTGGVCLVPAFTGMGAPHWDMYARGLLIGLTRGTGRAQICRAALEGIAFQSADLVAAMEKDADAAITRLKVDGGASVSDFMMGFQADLLRVPVERPKVVETTAWGAAGLAGLASGVWKDLAELEQVRQVDQVFSPKTDRSREWNAWRRAVRRSLDWSREDA